MKYTSDSENLQEMSEAVRQDVLQLMQQKSKIEGEIKELTTVLTTNGVGMSEPLVDAEGFPLNNIDVYQVRNARHQIICLQNDHKALMKQIENGLQGYYNAANVGNGHADNDPVNVPRHPSPVHKTPFAKITFVNPGSPADYAGLQVDDFIVEFGSVNSTNFKSVEDIGTIVRHSEGHGVNVKLRRGERYIVVEVIPKKWAGRGLFGCNVATEQIEVFAGGNPNVLN